MQLLRDSEEEEGTNSELTLQDLVEQAIPDQRIHLTRSNTPRVGVGSELHKISADTYGHTIASPSGGIHPSSAPSTQQRVPPHTIISAPRESPQSNEVNVIPVANYWQVIGRRARQTRINHILRPDANCTRLLDELQTYLF